MYAAKLERFAYLDDGTFGKLFIENKVYYTVEAPWKNNKPFISCLPECRYSLDKATSSKYGPTYALTNERIGVTVCKEPGSSRYACLLHPGNWPSDVEGCISPGLSLEANSKEFETPGPLMITSSRTALTQIWDYIERLNITHIQITHKDATIW